MKKFGFTLSELLITVGIVGVVAALTAPAVSNIMPDRNKMMFMKNYKELTTITEKLLNDPTLYYTKYKLDDDGRKNPTCIGLACWEKPINEKYQDDKYKSAGKYMHLCIDFLGKSSGNQYYFYTEDGTGWELPWMSRGAAGSAPWSLVGVSSDKRGQSLYFTVYAKNMGKSCYYGETDCKKPRKFWFKINDYGNLSPIDELSQAYLLNPNNMNNKKKDLACAAAIKADTAGKSPADICAELDD